MKYHSGKIGLIVMIVIIALILFFPIPVGPYDDGGTCTYDALTYKVVVWNRSIVTIVEDGQADVDPVYRKTSVYLFPYNLKSIDELWKIETAKN